jgi:hypothetical protein
MGKIICRTHEFVNGLAICVVLRGKLSFIGDFECGSKSTLAGPFFRAGCEILSSLLYLRSNGSSTARWEKAIRILFASGQEQQTCIKLDQLVASELFELNESVECSKSPYRCRTVGMKLEIVLNGADAMICLRS